VTREDEHMPDADSTLPDWLIDVPASAAVFDRYGLDSSCGGKSLDYVCRQAGVDVTLVLAELAALMPPADPPARG
jgi:iron-sulfur cluster repair protein YtfE (RIC family)